MLGMILLTMLVSIVIVSFVINRQNQENSNNRLQHAAHIVIDEILARQEKILANAQQLTGINEMPTKFQLLREYKLLDEPDLTMHTRQQILTDMQNMAVASNLRQIAVYDNDGDLLLFSYRNGENHWVGYRQPISIARAGYRKILVKEELRRISSTSGELTETLVLLPSRFTEPIPKRRFVRFERVDGALASVAYAPLLRSIVNVETLEIEKQQIGFVKVAQTLDQPFVETVSYLTDTQINIFLNSRRSVGISHIYQAPSPAMVPKLKERLDLTQQSILTNEIILGDKGFYQGVLGVYQGYSPIGSIQILYSKAIAEQLTQQTILLLSLVGLGSLLFALPFIFYLTNSISKPIESLTHGVRQIIEKNDLTLQVPVISSDEIGFLGKSFNEMVQKLEQSYSDLAESNAKLKKADKLKDEFLAKTSHELRTPLHGIIGIAQTLLTHPDVSLSDYLRSNLAMIINSGKRLAGLVGDILDFSKLQHDTLQLEMQEVDTHQVVELVLHLSSPLLLGRPVILRNLIPPDLPAAFADEKRLLQVLHNLIGNAIKFTEQGEITVETEIRDTFVAIMVTDTGVGIAEDRIDRIFHSFEQEDDSISRQYEGLGLGLSISKQLVELHSGNITVNSVKGIGSRFTFTLPLASSIEQAPFPLKEAPLSVDLLPPPEIHPAPVAFSNTGKALKILAIDDDPTNLQIILNSFGPQGYTVICQSNGVSALEWIQAQGPPDLILLDVMMPVMHGFDVCRELRQHYPLGALPIIFLTASHRQVDRDTGFSLGANDYLTKPFEQAELLARSRAHLQVLLARKQLLSLREYANRISTFKDHEQLFHFAITQIQAMQLASDVILWKDGQLSSLTIPHHEFLSKPPEMPLLDVYRERPEFPLIIVNLVQEQSPLALFYTPDQPQQLLGTHFVFVQWIKHDALLCLFREAHREPFNSLEREYLLNLLEQAQLIESNLKALLTDKMIQALPEIQPYLPQITHISSYSPYCKVYLENEQDPRLVQVSLSNLELYFDDSMLLKIHKSHLVNPKKILRIHKKLTKSKNYQVDVVVGTNEQASIALRVGKSFVPRLLKSYSHYLVESS